MMMVKVCFLQDKWSFLVSPIPDDVSLYHPHHAIIHCNYTTML